MIHNGGGHPIATDKGRRGRDGMGEERERETHEHEGKA